MRGPIWRSKRVPGLVSERVVDLLEVVEIDEQQGQAAACVAAAGQRGQGLLELVQEASTIPQPGELVGHGLVLARLVEGPLLPQGHGHPGRRHHERRAGEAEGDGLTRCRFPSTRITGRRTSR